ncbi:beta-ketoacyl-[acyl-carrier-protein] synthase family protein [Mucilaginibacter koreensis]
MNNNPVYIAGAGAVTAIGHNLNECLAAFEREEAGMAGISYLETAHQGIIPVAEVKLSNEELAAPLGVSPRLSRTALLSLTAATEALADADISNIKSLRTGFISANTVGGMDKTEQFFSRFMSNYQQGHLRDVVNHECGAVTKVVADALQIQDYITTINTACSSSANAIFLAARMIKQDLLDVAIAGGTDALTRFTLNGFNTLMILDREFCRPFDENRNGLNLGEGAGYVVLVSDRVAQNLSKLSYALLSGYANANDAYHQTASSPDGNGSYLAMTGALKRANLQPADINYINLHGTGTQNNDQAEGTAIRRVFGEILPALSSTKSFTGHTLGACGGLEAVFSVMAIQKGIIYPNLRFKTPISGLDIVPETRFQKNVKVEHVLSNSFGFGGNCSSLIFSKI